MAMKRAALAATMAVLLAGCGGGDSDDPSLGESSGPIVPDTESNERLFSTGDLSTEPSLGSEIPVGVYRYTAVEPQSGTELVGVGIISDTGRIALALQDRLSFARIELDEDDRFENLLEDTQFTDALSLSITGRRDLGVLEGENPRISGTFLDVDLDVLTLNYRLDLQDSDGDSFGLADLQGTYSGVDDEGSGTVVSIDDTGNLIGSDTSGCDFEGTIRIPDANQEVFEAKYTLANCGPTVTLTGSQRDGDYFAVGRIEDSFRSITMFGSNGEVGSRFTGSSTASEDQILDEEVPPFVSDEFDQQTSISAKLEPGIYNYTDIPLGNTPPPVVESGILYVSDTGRLALVTDSRFGVARVRVSDVDTFLNNLFQIGAPGATTAGTAAEAIFGTPNNTSGGDFTIAGSLLDREGELVNRYEAVRDTTNDAFFSSTPLTVTRLAGTYSGTRNPGAITTTINVAPTGEVTGSDTTGCVFNGTANVNTGESGIFEFRLTVSNCSASTEASGAERNGIYNAVGDIVPGTPDRMRVLMGSDDNVEYLQLDLQ